MNLGPRICQTLGKDEWMDGWMDKCEGKMLINFIKCI